MRASVLIFAITEGVKILSVFASIRICSRGQLFGNSYDWSDIKKNISTTYGFESLTYGFDLSILNVLIELHNEHGLNLKLFNKQRDPRLIIFMKKSNGTWVFF